MKVFGLYGRSGTGKSHTAQIFANKLGVDAIIDDGILIVNQDYIAGVSAKCEAFLHAATKRAIFYWEEPRLEVASFIRNRNIKQLIILGTSQKMITCILDKLGISTVVEWVPIESLKTKDELDIAASRRKEGFHAIPINPIHVAKIYNGWYGVERLHFYNYFIEISVVKPFGIK